MTALERHSRKQRIDNLFSKVGAFAADGEMQSHWVAYLCVIVCGFLDTTVRSVYSEYASTRAEPAVQRFVGRQLRRQQNLNMEKILQICEAFDHGWRVQLEAAVQGERAASVNSIVANRNRIAHGDSVDLTYGQLNRYYERTLEVVNQICVQCGVAALA
jgi:hypothetical protein